MPDAPRIEQLITDFIQQEILGSQAAAIDPDDNLFTSGYVDSVGIVRLIAHLESALSITIPPTDLVPGNFRTVRVMAAYLAGRNGHTPDQPGPAAL